MSQTHTRSVGKSSFLLLFHFLYEGCFIKVFHLDKKTKLLSAKRIILKLMNK